MLSRSARMAVQCGQLIPGPQHRVELGRQRGEVAGVPQSRRVQLAPLGQPFDAVFADGLQHPVAQPAADRLQQRLVDQRQQQVTDIVCGDAGWSLRDRRVIVGLIVTAHRDRSRQVGAGREDRQPFGDQSLLLGQQVPTPLDHRAQGPVPGHRGAVAAGQQPEPVGQPGGDLPDRQHPQPRRGQFDGQRQPVESADDLDDLRDVGRRRPRSRR